ncbi:hypothetical protein [Mycoplasma parvum]|uniref:Uncharacterized protein n=1 Tax=Mycoplasma parvum str. Indiana TaxID=1403316 RepID=U5NGE9_9MOLU|nr:hypothetical protein [Mycoplasma parvum]AGX89323.1 hypothetical protein PRV_02990 [Mycoplasma parvum str. Indiana]
MFLFYSAATVATVFGALGATFLFVVSYIHWKVAFDSKNTSGLITKFLIFSCVTAILFIAGNLFDMGGTSWDFSTKGISYAMIAGNVFSFVANFLVFKLKKSNMKAAKEAGLSEQDYYLKHVAPTLSAK